MLLIGRNSVNPWTTARTMTWKMGIKDKREGWGGRMSSCGGTLMWGQAFWLAGAPGARLCPAFFGPPRDAGHKPGGKPEGLTPHIRYIPASSADGPYMPGTATSQSRRYMPSWAR